MVDINTWEDKLIAKNRDQVTIFFFAYGSKDKLLLFGDWLPKWISILALSNISFSYFLDFFAKEVNRSLQSNFPSVTVCILN